MRSGGRARDPEPHGSVLDDHRRRLHRGLLPLRRLRQNVAGQLTADRPRQAVLFDLVEQRATRDAKGGCRVRAIVTVLDQRSRDLGTLRVPADRPKSLGGLRGLLGRFRD
jgi:hypothetical protein